MMDERHYVIGMISIVRTFVRDIYLYHTVNVFAAEKARPKTFQKRAGIFFQVSRKSFFFVLWFLFIELLKQMTKISLKFLNEAWLTVLAIYFECKILLNRFFQIHFYRSSNNAASANLCIGQQLSYVVDVTCTERVRKGSSVEFWEGLRFG